MHYLYVFFLTDSPIDMTPRIANVTYTEINESVTLTVKFRAFDEKLEVFWSLNNTPISAEVTPVGPRDVFNSSLDLEVKDTDLGVYTINVSNSVGFLLINVQLEVYSKYLKHSESLLV